MWFSWKWDFENVNFVENEALKIFFWYETMKMWILWKWRVIISKHILNIYQFQVVFFTLDSCFFHSLSSLDVFVPINESDTRHVGHKAKWTSVQQRFLGYHCALAIHDGPKLAEQSEHINAALVVDYDHCWPTGPGEFEFGIYGVHKGPFHAWNTKSTYLIDSSKYCWD